MNRIEKIKMFLSNMTFAQKSAVLLCMIAAGLFAFAMSVRCVDETLQPQEETKTALSPKPDFVRGIHITSWSAGSKKARERIAMLMHETELNSVVIDLKEYQGEIYIPGIPLAEKHNLYVNAIPDLKDYLSELNRSGVYTIARIVVFKDNLLPRKRPELGVKRPDGTLWQDHRHVTWTDPYNREVWDYNLNIAAQAVAMGFDEIQFDYIRFPSDGDIKQCRYSYASHSSSSAVRNLQNFLQTASKRLKGMGARVSIDIFGLTPSVPHDMGIGQKIVELTETVDYVSPMVYPSHYARGEYGIAEPNREPYRVVHRTMTDALKRLGDQSRRLRPWLQDFSLGVKYGPSEVRAQIQACEDAGIYEWLLWNAASQYTQSALRSEKDAARIIAKEMSVTSAAQSPSKNAPQRQTEIEKNGQTVPGPGSEEEPNRVHD